jgi:hypothetical protein
MSAIMALGILRMEYIATQIPLLCRFFQAHSFFEGKRDAEIPNLSKGTVCMALQP